jgi:hypothetical protein
MPGKCPERHKILWRTRDREGWKIFAYGIVPGEFPLCFQYGNGKCCNGFGHGSDTKDSIFMYRVMTLYAPDSISFFKNGAFRPFYTDADIRQAVLGNQILNPLVYCGKIKDIKHSPQ